MALDAIVSMRGLICIHCEECVGVKEGAGKEFIMDGVDGFRTLSGG